MTVYSLTASDEPLQVRYVGATGQHLETRLSGHWGQFCNPGKRAWMKAVVARGAKVEIRPLSTHDTVGETADAERRWVAFWRQYCDLLNLQTPTRINCCPDTVRKPRPKPVSFLELADAIGQETVVAILEAERLHRERRLRRNETEWHR